MASKETDTYPLADFPVADTFAQRVDPPDDFVDGTPRQLDADVAQNLLRIVQEALTNALRHATARRFTARLTYDADQVHLELRDDGPGFDPAANHDGFGLLGMKERVEIMGGRILIESIPKMGTTISIVIGGNQSPRSNHV